MSSQVPLDYKKLKVAWPENAKDIYTLPEWPLPFKHLHVYAMWEGTSDTWKYDIDFPNGSIVQSKFVNDPNTAAHSESYKWAAVSKHSRNEDWREEQNFGKDEKDHIPESDFDEDDPVIEHKICAKHLITLPPGTMLRYHDNEPRAPEDGDKQPDGEEDKGEVECQEVILYVHPFNAEDPKDLQETFLAKFKAEGHEFPQLMGWEDYEGQGEPNEVKIEFT